LGGVPRLPQGLPPYPLAYIKGKGKKHGGAVVRSLNDWTDIEVLSYQVHYINRIIDVVLEFVRLGLIDARELIRSICEASGLGYLEFLRYERYLTPNIRFEGFNPSYDSWSSKFKDVRWSDE